jgi:hypothetical protein
MYLDAELKDSIVGFPLLWCMDSAFYSEDENTERKTSAVLSHTLFIKFIFYSDHCSDRCVRANDLKKKLSS